MAWQDPAEGDYMADGSDHQPYELEDEIDEILQEFGNHVWAMAQEHKGWKSSKAKRQLIQWKNENIVGELKSLFDESETVAHIGDVYERIDEIEKKKK